MANATIKQTGNCKTWWARIYISGPIEVAKQLLREECLRVGLCVTIEPTHFVYSGGEEAGYVVGLINYPRFPMGEGELVDRAFSVMQVLLEGTSQHSALVQFPDETSWVSKRDA